MRLVISAFFWAVLYGCTQTEITYKAATSVIFYENGKPKIVHIYGKAEDSTFVRVELYPDSAVRKSIRYVNGQKQGAHVGYYANGDTAFLEFYTDDVKAGIARFWWENRNLQAKWEFENGLVVGGGNYYENGQLIGDLTFKDGKLVSGIYYYEDGTLRSEGSFDSQTQKHGLWREYHPNGNLKTEGVYVSGRPVGLWKQWDEEGNLAEQKDFDEIK